MTNKNFCCVCGNYNNKWQFKKIISDELAESWQLTKELRLKFDQRESQFCPRCGNSARTRSLALAIMQVIKFSDTNNFSDWIDKANKTSIKVAEINSCGKLHKILAKKTNLSYSEFPSSHLLARFYNKLKHIPYEDITSLSYTDNSFDLVLHSEVLEHVPDINKAISECRRVLKPKGICLFTIPIINKRKTIKCAEINKGTGKIVSFKNPSYHGLDKRKDNMVWWEFGDDIIKKCNLEIIRYDQDVITYIFALRKN